MSNRTSRCFGHPECVMTAGYSIGGGHYICWLHILQIPGGSHYYRSKPVIMPTVEQQQEMATTWTEDEKPFEERMLAWTQLLESRQQ